MAVEALRRTTRIILAVMSAIPAAYLCGCSGYNGIRTGQIVGGATKQVRDVVPVGGFLPKPSLLSEGGQANFALMYRNPAVAPGTYNALILDPVTIWTGPNSSLESIPYAERQAIADEFTSDLYQVLKTKCRMTRTSGPGTAHVLPGPPPSRAMPSTA